MKEFLDVLSESKTSLYGLQPETLDSLILSILPNVDFKYKKVEECDPVGDTQLPEVRVYLIKKVLDLLRTNAGFHFQEVLIVTF